MPELILQPIGGYLLVAIVTSILAGLLLLGVFLTKASLPKRLALVSLRGAAIAVLLFAMLQPTLVYTETKKNSATLVFLIDRSKSMQIADGGLAGMTRWDLAADSMLRSLPAIDALAEDLEIKYYTFDGRVYPLDRKDGKLELPSEPDGEESAIGPAIDEVLRLEAGKQVKAIVLLSDGAQRTVRERSLPPQAAAGRMRNRGIPLYTVVLGENRNQEQARDLAVTELNVSPTVFVKNELAVTGMVRINGFVNQPIKVELLYEVSGKLKVVDSRTVQSAENGAQVKFDLSCLPEVPGEHKLMVRAVPHPIERIKENNELATFITVLKGGVNALYVEGRPRAEQKYIRWSLGASPNIHVDFHEVDAARGLPPEANEWFLPGKYDAYIIGDLDSTAFKDDQLKALRERVKGGAGLMMLGGFNSFNPGGYQRTWLYLDKDRKVDRTMNPNAEFDYLPSPVLPILMIRDERQDLGKSVQSQLHLVGEQKMIPTEQGLRHFLMALGDKDQSVASWAKLPPLDGANRFRGLTGGAVVLAKNAKDDPLLITQNFGEGRVVAFAGDSTWRWWMRGFQKEHRRFWRQILLYLSRKDESDESGVWVKLPRRRFSKNDRVELTAGAQTPEGEPIVTASFKAEVLMPDGNKLPVPLRRNTLDFSGVFGETILPGDYTVQVTATRPGEADGSAKARFIVRQQDLELDNPAAEPGVLSSLAATTDGRFLAPEQLPGALEELKLKPMNLEVSQQTKRELWDNWGVLLLFVGCLAVEWFLRKRWGLV